MIKCANPECLSQKVFAQGLCAGCYSRRRRRGTLDRKNVVNRGACTVEGCDRNAFSKNLCTKHYQQAQHPLRTIWRTLRSRANGGYPAAWERFNAFLEDVGERPSPLHQLRRPDADIPWGPDNFVWREPVGVGRSSGTAEERAAYFRAWDLRKKYGLSDEQVAAMEDAQDGLCPICLRPLRRCDPDTGKPVRVCVDHDHVTRVVRALLDDPCNKGLGLFEDDPERLDSAAAYVRHHKSRSAPDGQS